MSYNSAALDETKIVDSTIPLLIIGVVLYYTICIVFVVCALPFLLLSVPIEYLLKDRPRAHGNAVVFLIAMSITSSIVSPTMIVYSYLT